MKNNKNKYFDIVSNKDDIDLKINWNEKAFITNNIDVEPFFILTVAVSIQAMLSVIP